MNLTFNELFNFVNFIESSMDLSKLYRLRRHEVQVVDSNH